MTGSKDDTYLYFGDIIAEIKSGYKPCSVCGKGIRKTCRTGLCGACLREKQRQAREDKICRCKDCGKKLEKSTSIRCWDCYLKHIDNGQSPEEERERRLKYHRDYYERNKGMFLEYAKEHAPTSETRRMNRLCRIHHLTKEEYNELMIRSNGHCEICGREIKVQKCNADSMVIDHDHEKGYIRGIICNQCNTAMGLLGDNIESIERVLMYMKKAKEKNEYLLKVEA